MPKFYNLRIPRENKQKFVLILNFAIVFRLIRFLACQMNIGQPQRSSADSGLDAIEFELSTDRSLHLLPGVNANAPDHELDSAIDLRFEPDAQDLETTSGRSRERHFVRNYCHFALFMMLMFVPGIMLIMLLIGPLRYNFPFNACFNFQSIKFNIFIHILIINSVYYRAHLQTLGFPLSFLCCKARTYLQYNCEQYQCFSFPGILLIFNFINFLFIGIKIFTVDEIFVNCCNKRIAAVVNQSINVSLHLPILVNKSSIKWIRFTTMEYNNTDYKDSNTSYLPSLSPNSTELFEINQNSERLFKFQVWLFLVSTCLLLRLGYLASDICLTWRAHWSDRPKLDNFRRWMSVRRCCNSANCIRFAPLLCALTFAAIALLPTIHYAHEFPVPERQKQQQRVIV